jgi:glycosyltransferase involved in cell wall biosynthesis
MPRVSVVCCIYNAEKYLRSSLDSLLQQTYSDLEVLLIDDGSTDNSLAIAREYFDRNSHFRLLTNDTNYGLAVARNRGVFAARGDYVAIHDADDVSLPNRISEQVDYLDAHLDITVLGAHAIKIDPEGDHVGFLCYPPSDTVRSLWVLRNWKLNPIIDPTSMFRRSIILDAGGYSMDPDYRLMPDLELWCRLLCKRHKIANLQKPLIKYRINPAGLTVTKDKEIREKNEIVWSKLRRMNFEQPVLRPGFFKQACFSEFERGK